MTDAPIVAERPADVIDLRREQVQFWNTYGPLQRAFGIHGRRRSAPDFVVPEGLSSDRVRELEAQASCRWLRGVMRDAELYWVAPDMVDVLAEIAPSIPDVYPRPPMPEALVVFAKGMAGHDAVSGKVIHTAAYLWGPVTVWRADCVGIETFGWRNSMLAADEDIPDADKQWWRESVPLRLAPTGSLEWPLANETSDFSYLEPEDAVMAESMLEDRRLMAAFWALVDQKLTVETLDYGNRPARRRAERAGVKLDPVRVIRLRERAPRTESAEQREVNWSHRWLVGRHWRQQWYPSTGEHKAKLIEPYVKGPSDRPFVPRETVRALMR